jgi:unsaturated rhamnogalacturonyl hydrolase
LNPFRIAVLSLATAAAASASKAIAPSRFDGESPLEWSERMAHSEMHRRGNALFSGEDSKATWNYTSGFLAYALRELGRETGDATVALFGTRIVDSFIGADGTIRGYSADEYNLDQITPGRVVLDLYRETGDQKYRMAAGALRRQLAGQPRTYDSGFWHKLIYPDQMWLDGLYMSGPFYANYGADFKDPAATDDAFRQILLADEHLYDPRAGLYYHAWDAKHVQAWADPKTGHSPSFWGRSIGWLAMATVDELDIMPADSSRRNPLRAVLGRIARGIVRWQDPGTGVWWQVVDQGARDGNYRESSASCMYVYALAKSVERGWLPRESFMPAAVRGYAGLVQEFIREDASGQVRLTHCCSVAGLNGRNAAGRARDGSFAYYASEPVVENDLKAVPAFILAGLEVQRMLALAPSTP